jgi:hypothetical protein
VDSAGSDLWGVTVLISSPDIQGTRTTLTDAEGEFRFVHLPPGRYLAKFSLAGYQVVEQRNIRVPIEGVITIHVEIPAEFAGEVVVNAVSPVVDVTSTAVSTTFSEETLTGVPTGRDFSSVAFLAAGAVEGGGVADDRLAGNPSIMGASALENRYVVDQLDTTDVAEGRAGTRIPVSFISEVQVKTAGYEAEYGGALGGVVNMLTRSGGNEFHGELFGFLTNESLWAPAKVPETRGEAKTADLEWDTGFTLGGSIVKDKLWFFLGYDPSVLDQRVRNDLFTVTGEFFRSNEFVRHYDRQLAMAKLTWQANQNISLTGTVLHPITRSPTCSTTPESAASTGA